MTWRHLIPKERLLRAMRRGQAVVALEAVDALEAIDALDAVEGLEVLQRGADRLRLRLQMEDVQLLLLQPTLQFRVLDAAVQGPKSSFAC